VRLALALPLFARPARLPSITTIGLGIATLDVVSVVVAIGGLRRSMSMAKSWDAPSDDEGVEKQTAVLVQE